MTIAEDLVTHLIESHRTTDETNRILRELTMRMDMFFASSTAHKLLTSAETSEIWKAYVTPAGAPVANVRIATVDLATLFDDDVVFLKPTDKDPRPRSDGSGKKVYAENPPVQQFNPRITENMIEYLRRVLGSELAPLVKIAHEAAASSTAGNRKAIVSVDYYSDRSTTTSVLHKDTAGTTLFVALHYINSVPMLGPEYIHDKWPVQGAGENPKHNFTPYVKGPSPDSSYDKRYAAPWMRYKGYYFWPRKLLKELEIARAQLPDDKTLHHVTLGPYGLVSFVDELIYHATPFNKSRTKEAIDNLFRDVTFAGLSYKVLPPKLTRTVSTSLADGETLPSMTGGSSKRCFIRLWISVVTNEWYTELTRFSM